MCSMPSSGTPHASIPPIVQVQARSWPCIAAVSRLAAQSCCIGSVSVPFHPTLDEYSDIVPSCRPDSTPQKNRKKMAFFFVLPRFLATIRPRNSTGHDCAMIRPIHVILSWSNHTKHVTAPTQPASNRPTMPFRGPKWSLLKAKRESRCAVHCQQFPRGSGPQTMRGTRVPMFPHGHGSWSMTKLASLFIAPARIQPDLLRTSSA